MIRAARSYPVPAEPRTDSRAEAAHDRRRDDRDFAKHMRASQKPARKPDGTPNPDAQPQPGQQPEAKLSLTEIVAAWLGGKHAEGQSIAIGAGKPATPTAAQPDATAAITADAAQPTTATPPAPKPELPLTPLEQAVHDLLGELDHAEREPNHAEGDTQVPIATPLAAATELERATDSPAPQPIAAPAPIALPAEQAITHYTHLVLDDGSGVQVSMRIAVRGETVNVALKSNDDATAAALARNAGVLNEAIRGRGLDMSNFTAERDHDQSQRNREPRERQQPTQERFQLEDK